MRITRPKYWVKHWRARRALANYPLYDVPHKVCERELPEAKALENFDYFMSVKDQRLKYFQNWITDKFKLNANLSPEGAQDMSRWADEYAGGLVREEEQLVFVFANYSAPWSGDYACCNVMIDLMIFMGEYLIARGPKDQIAWTMFKGDKRERATFRSISFRKPTIKLSKRHWADVYTDASGFELGDIWTDPALKGSSLVESLKQSLYLARMPDDQYIIGDSRDEQL